MVRGVDILLIRQTLYRMDKSNFILVEQGGNSQPRKYTRFFRGKREHYWLNRISQYIPPRWWGIEYIKEFQKAKPHKWVVLLTKQVHALPCFVSFSHGQLLPPVNACHRPKSGGHRHTVRLQNNRGINPLGCHIYSHLASFRFSLLCIWAES